MLLDMAALDAVALPYEEFIALRLHEHAKFATIGGPSLATCLSPMLMSKRTWNRLSPRQRQAVEEAAAVSDVYFEREQVDVERKALVAFEKAGAQVRSLTDEEYGRWLKLGRETVWARYAATNELSREFMNTAIEASSRIRP